MPGGRPAILVTGGSRGIGAAICRLAAARGFDVAVNYVSSEDEAARVVAACRQAGGNAVAVQGDVALPEAVEAMFGLAEAALGPLSHVVSNAGTTGRAGRLAETDPDVIRSVIDLNVTGAILVAREAARRLARGDGRDASIVTLSSVAAGLGSPGEYVWYAASKGAVDTLTIGLARELARDGIRVNAVSPGLIATEIHERSSRDGARIARLLPNVPMGRVGEADEVAEAVLFLMSPAASYITGAIIKVSGGR